MWRRVFSSSSSSSLLKTLGWRSSPQILARNPSRALFSLPVHPQSRISATKVASGPVFQQALRFSTGDSDTHEDFRPTSNLQSSGITLQDVVRQDVEKNPVMIYMKGNLDAPRCGFSALAVKVLQQYNVPIRGRNILEDSQLKESIKAFSNWPTFPQIFIKGEFIGGSDIVLTMHQDGKLKKLLEDINADNGKA